MVDAQGRDAAKERVDNCARPWNEYTSGHRGPYALLSTWAHEESGEAPRRCVARRARNP